MYTSRSQKHASRSNTTNSGKGPWIAFVIMRRRVADVDADKLILLYLYFLFPTRVEPGDVTDTKNWLDGWNAVEEVVAAIRIANLV